MLASQADARTSVMPSRTRLQEGGCAGVLASTSDSMVGDSREAQARFGSSDVKQSNPVPKAPKSPAFRHRLTNRTFLFGFSWLPRKSRYSLRQLKTVHAWPERIGSRMATSSHFSASLLYGLFSELSHTQDSVSMFNPEVAKCR